MEYTPLVGARSWPTASVARTGSCRTACSWSGSPSRSAWVAVLAYTPVLASLFHLSGLGPWHWLFLLLWPPLVLAAEEARKGAGRRRRPAAVRVFPHP